MIELWLLGGAGGFVLFLWWRNRYLKRQLKAQTERAETAEAVAAYQEKMSAVERERSDNQAERIEEIIDDAEKDDFSDFYEPNDTNT